MKNCPKCGKPHYKPGSFCSRSCANSRVRTEESKQKTRNSLQGRINPNAFKGTKPCECCGKSFNITCYTKKIKYCSTECMTKCRSAKCRLNGLKSASSTTRRSRNEVYFAGLCSKDHQILCNVPMFNGWDADIVIESAKVAILWNGPWHYKQITKKHSLLQVQNRDKIKLLEIQKAGYIPYVIRDDGSYNTKFVDVQYEIFKKWLGSTTNKYAEVA